ncbi:hypothetical protein L9F63_008895, partial [Diploptera punctata]
MEFQAIKHEDGLIQTEIEPQDMRVEIKSEFFTVYYCPARVVVSQLTPCFIQRIFRTISHTLDKIPYDDVPDIDVNIIDVCSFQVEENEGSLDKLVENSQENVTTFHPNVLLIEEDKCVVSTNNVVNNYSPSQHSKTRRKDDLGPHLSKVFKCAVCNRGFSYKSHCRRHELIHSKEEKLKSFKCDVCYKLFPYKSHYNRHILIHRGEKPFKCSLCNKAYRWKSYLKIHIRVHSNDKPFKCSFCHRVFSMLSNFKRHERVHSGEKPLKCFKCDHCDKLFSDKCNLRRHMNIHSNKPFKCTFCNRVFSDKSNLRRHNRIHTNDKPLKIFECDFCNKLFSDKSNLNRHLIIHYNDKGFKCPICNKCYASRNLFTKHSQGPLFFVLIIIWQE